MSNSGVVARSLAELGTLKAGVDEAVDRFRPRDVSWFVDEPNNVVVVTVAKDSRRQPDTAQFMRAVRKLGDGVQVKIDAEGPRLSAGIQDGDEITSLSFKPCSAGWWVKDASGADLVMTAGHCIEGDGGNWHHNGLLIGGSVKSEFGPSDWGLIHVDDIAAPRPTTQVDLYDGSFAKISGFSRAPIGATVCKSGLATKQTCGPVTAYDASFTSRDRTVTGMTQAAMCNAGGDSGGPVYQFDPDREGHVLAQGILTSRRGECPDGTTSYTPIDSALSDSETIFVKSSD